MLKPPTSAIAGKTGKYGKHLEFVFSLHPSLYSRLTTNSSCAGIYIHIEVFMQTLQHLSVTAALSPCSHLAHYFRNNEILWTSVSYIELQISGDDIKIPAKPTSPCSATDFTVTLVKSALQFSQWKVVHKGMRRINSPLIGWCLGVVHTGKHKPTNSVSFSESELCWLFSLIMSFLDCG